MSAIQKGVIIAGAVLLAVGLLWPWLGKLPLGRLPGDIVIRRPGFTFYLPLTTLVLVNLVLWLVVWWWRR